jgi:2-oxo-4-hydroxy-4-carboxy-5-ureidoimidazoline decarboxylase
MRLSEFNKLPKNEAKENLFRCCGCTHWVDELMNYFPFESILELKNKSDGIWSQCDEGDLMEAFSHHPKIGEKPEEKHESTAGWASNEQSGVNSANDNIRRELAEINYKYEKKFGYIYIVCATGKSAPELLEILLSRLDNDPQDELKVAASEQNKITHLRIDKLFA